ncbi:MAG TPA: BlaI/MecI/CopY family transcriptional regulator [Caulobacteraceae bacterium]
MQGEVERLFVAPLSASFQVRRRYPSSMTPTWLIEAVQSRREWGGATIKTLLGRLMQKKAVRSRRDDGRLLYDALLSLEDYAASEAQRLADRVFEGDPIRLAAFISERFHAGDPAVREGSRPAPRPGRGYRI